MTATRTVSPPSRSHRIAAILVEGGWLAVVVLVPLAVNPWTFNYELVKAALFRGLALLMLVAHFVALAWAPTLPNPRRWSGRPLVRPILLVAGATLLSTFVSLSPLVSIWGSHHRQQGACLLFCLVLWALLVAAHLRTPAQRSRLATAIVVAGTLVALTPFIESFRWRENPLTWRPGGSLGNPIFLGAYLIMVAPFTLAKVVDGLGRAETLGGRKRLGPESRYLTLGRAVIGWAALALQLFALLITQSRGPWVGALAGLALFAALVLWPTHRRPVLGGLAAGVLLIGGLLAGLNFGLAPSSSVSRLPYVNRIVAATDLSGGTARVRIVLWQAAGRVVTTWPEVGLGPDRWRALRPLLGYGPDTAAIVYTAAYPPELAHIEDPSAIWDRAHNETLDLLAMQGWLGMAAWVVLGVACARRGLALWRAARDPIERAWAAAPLAALVAHAVESQFAFSLTATGMMAWLCVAWLAAPSLTTAPTGGWKEGESRRWRAYAVVGAMLLVLVAVRVEAGVILGDALVGRGRALDEAGEWGESVALYDRTLALIPWQAEVHQLRAEAFYNLARAMPDDQTALKAELLAAADRGLVLARRLEPLELEHYSNGGVLHAYWSESVDPSHLETAVAFYQQAFRLAPTRADLRVDLGHVYHNHARYVEALAQYQDALEIDSRSAAAYYGSGLAWQALGERDLARQAFRDALSLAPDCDVCEDALQALGE